MSFPWRARGPDRASTWPYSLDLHTTLDNAAHAAAVGARLNKHSQNGRDRPSSMRIIACDDASPSRTLDVARLSATKTSHLAWRDFVVVLQLFYPNSAEVMRTPGASPAIPRKDREGRSIKRAARHSHREDRVVTNCMAFPLSLCADLAKIMRRAGLRMGRANRSSSAIRCLRSSSRSRARRPFYGLDRTYSRTTGASARTGGMTRLDRE
jgi:hypothetical protein